MEQVHVYPVTVYYEDTDFSGVVYHANYLKYFERAREHILGVSELVRLYKEGQAGYVVHKIEVTFRQPAVHGDQLEVRSAVRLESAYRLVFDQAVWRCDSNELLVRGLVHVVCVDGQRRLVTLPASALALVGRPQEGADLAAAEVLDSHPKLS